MNPTLPIDLALNLAVGASFAVASRARLVDEGPVNNTALMSLLAFQALVFVPVGAYLLVRYPDWCFMYLVNGGSLFAPDWAFALGAPVLALVGFFSARLLVLRDKTVFALGLFGGSLALAVAIGAFGFRQLSLVGTTTAYRGEGAGLRPLLDTGLPFSLAAGILAILVAWALALSRLRRLGRATKLREQQVAATLIRAKEEQEAELKRNKSKPKSTKRPTRRKSVR